MAIEAENRSILFYVGMQNLVQAKADREKLEAIIREDCSCMYPISRAVNSERNDLADFMPEKVEELDQRMTE